MGKTGIDSFVGRRRELAQLRAALGSGARLVTVLGPGGIGKTRLVREAAARRWVNGRVHVVELATARSVPDVLRAVARSLGLPAAGAGKSVEAEQARVGRELARARVRVLVLDNYEQLARRAAALPGALLALAGGLRLVLTSRVRLGVPGERVLRVEPLPPADALRLFEERARAAGAGDALAGAQQLVRALHGVPLALELTAARLATLPLEALLAPARGGGAGAALRQTLERSWRLLPARDRRTLADASVFRGPFDFEAAQAVLGRGARTAEALEALCDASLLRAARAPGAGLRYTLLEPIREFAAARRGPAPAGLLRAYARHTLARAEAALAQLWGPQGEGALEALLSLEPHLAAIAERRGADGARALVALEPVRLFQGSLEGYARQLERAVASGPKRGALAAAAQLSLGRVCHELGRGARALRALDAALQAAPRGAAQLRGRALLARGRLRSNLGRWREALDDFGRAAQLGAAWGLRWVEAMAQASRYFYGSELRRDARALPALAEAVELLAGAGEPREALFWAVQAGRAFCELGETQQGERYLAAAQLRAQALGDRRAEAMARFGLGSSAMGRGQLARGRALLEEAAAALGELEAPRYAGYAAGYAGLCAFAQGELAPAQQALAGAVERLTAAGDLPNARLFQGALAALAARRGELSRAQALLALAGRGLTARADPFRARALWLHEGQLLLARAEQALRAGDDARAQQELARAQARLARARRRPAYGRRRTWVEESYEPALAALLLEQALLAAQAPGEALCVGADGGWFRLPGAAPVEVPGRGTLRRLLRALARHRASRPGEVLPREALVTEGWPGERVLPAAAANRLYVALDGLRRLGLSNVLLRAGKGWRLDETVPLRLVPQDFKDAIKAGALLGGAPPRQTSAA